MTSSPVPWTVIFKPAVPNDFQSGGNNGDVTLVSLPSGPASGRTMTDMACIADTDRPFVPEVVRGRRPKTGGRQKGTPNRITADVRATLRELAEANAGRVQEWLDRVAEDDPGEAIRLYLSLCRYVVPVLSAAAVSAIGHRRLDRRPYQLQRAERDRALGRGSNLSRRSHRRLVPGGPYCRSPRGCGLHRTEGPCRGSFPATGACSYGARCHRRSASLRAAIACGRVSAIGVSLWRVLARRVDIRPIALRAARVLSTTSQTFLSASIE